MYMVSFYYWIKSGRKGFVKEYVVYIEWLGRYLDWEDLVYVGNGNMFDWIEGNLVMFWKVVDIYECVNGVVYWEYVIVLLNEFSLE